MLDLRQWRISFVCPVAAAVAVAAALVACDGDGEGDGGFEGDPTVLPDDPADYSAWLEAQGYREWRGESAPHASRGPHPGTVQAYFNPTLEATLEASNTHHPVGSAAVKEFYADDGKLRGWSLSVKIAETSDEDLDPASYYWMEKLDGEVTVSDAPVSLCYDCHSGAFGEGRDHVLSFWPLQF